MVGYRFPSEGEQHMRRREFIALVGGAVLGHPLDALAQPDGRLRRVGFLTAASSSVFSSLYAAFVQAMHQLGYEEHKDYITEVRTAEGRYERFPELARELVEQKPDVLLTAVAAAIRYLQQATTTIPIVMVYSTDPVENGFVASLSHPAGNITGLIGSSDDTTPKQLELLRTLAPNASRIGILGNPASPTFDAVVKSARASAEKDNFSVLPIEVHSAEEIDDAFLRLQKEDAKGLVVAAEAVFFNHRSEVAQSAIRNRLPSIFSQREYAVSGGLMSYGENLSDFFGRAAFFVDKIFKGTNPGDIPVEQPTRFHLTINRKTADALGLTIPSQLYIFADEVIE
jgi:putative tryptophan/tyrosine transport system substrate-binding protein